MWDVKYLKAGRIKYFILDHSCPQYIVNLTKKKCLFLCCLGVSCENFYHRRSFLSERNTMVWASPWEPSHLVGFGVWREILSKGQFLKKNCHEFLAIFIEQVQLMLLSTVILWTQHQPPSLLSALLLLTGVPWLSMRWWLRLVVNMWWSLTSLHQDSMWQAWRKGKITPWLFAHQMRNTGWTKTAPKDSQVPPLHWLVSFVAKYLSYKVSVMDTALYLIG